MPIPNMTERIISPNNSYVYLYLKSYNVYFKYMKYKYYFACIKTYVIQLLSNGDTLFIYTSVMNMNRIL